MSNGFYNIATSRMLTGLFNWTAGGFQMYLLSQSYVFNPAHQHVSDLGASVIANATILNPETSSDGWACATGIKFPSLIGSPGQIVTYAAIAEGALSGSNLVAYYDTMFELPFTPDGNDWYILGNSSHAGTAAGSAGWFRP
jgi:hypothetical protein